MTELRLRKERNRLHFYFGDTLELCLTNEELHNKMHVIHCSVGLVRYARLPNILPSVIHCLNNDMKEAVLVTETIASHFEKQTPTLVDSVESELYCPLTMIPTIYGVKLLDHVRLGSSVCCQLHDHFKAAAPITFKWYKTPVSFSANVQMEISATLKKVIVDLVETCFGYASDSMYSSHQQKNCVCALHLRTTSRESPLTFYNILQPFFSRQNWVKGATESLIEQCLSFRYQLTWRTIKDWMAGKQVCYFTTTARICVMPSSKHLACMSVAVLTLEL